MTRIRVQCMKHVKLCMNRATERAGRAPPPPPKNRNVNGNSSSNLVARDKKEEFKRVEELDIDLTEEDDTSFQMNSTENFESPPDKEISAPQFSLPPKPINQNGKKNNNNNSDNQNMEKITNGMGDDNIQSPMVENEMYNTTVHIKNNSNLDSPYLGEEGYSNPNGDEEEHMGQVRLRVTSYSANPNSHANYYSQQSCVSKKNKTKTRQNMLFSIHTNAEK
ncbi:p21-activated protein kinase [Reticulomyxa filosa]|uniref:p21-activated protein kinase n=1 Tax=Reticulomyxa filosa TaxID=46433 RepID=X6MQP5_RETFI|nr:p21-activated protein kinase [Reticulomyxa filosa]|eukprot:ETO16189.1 p21-activated protein kinase [Reticulomyxa filosa]